MLFSATVSGMPEFSRLANCWVKVASSWSLGLRLRCRTARTDGGSKVVRSRFSDGGCSAAAAAATLPLEASTMMGKSPSLSICTSAAERSWASRTACTVSPVRRRAL